MMFSATAFNPLRNEIKAQRERLTAKASLATVLADLNAQPATPDNWILVETLGALNAHRPVSPAAWCTLSPCAQQQLVTMLQAYMDGEFRHYRAQILQLQQRYLYE